MSTFTLKLLAIICMLIDHIGYIFIPGNSVLYLVFRCIGRLAFPIFIFLIVEGFYHTRDVKKYLTRLGAFALISEIPFDLAFNGKLIDNSYQNVFFTLFLGLLLITFMDMVEKKFPKQMFISNVIDAMLTIAFCAIAFFLRTDYGYGGILMIAAFYLFRGSKVLMTLTVVFISSSIFGNINILEAFAMIPIALYNGQKGKNAKYLFYIFYPAHLLILYLINQWMF